MYDVIEGRKTIAEVKRTCPDFDLLDVVPASIDLSGAELEVADMENRNVLLKTAVDEFLETSEEHYDYVIIDCPPSLGLLVINAMCAVHEMLIPIQLSTMRWKVSASSSIPSDWCRSISIRRCWFPPC